MNQSWVLIYKHTVKLKHMLTILFVSGSFLYGSHELQAEMHCSSCKFALVKWNKAAGHIDTCDLRSTDKMQISKMLQLSLINNPRKRVHTAIRIAHYWTEMNRPQAQHSSQICRIPLFPFYHNLLIYLIILFAHFHFSVSHDLSWH